MRRSNDQNQLTIKIAKIQSKIMAFVMAVLGGLGIFIATVILLIRGGDNVGAHLQLLGNYFPGYSVSWTGSIIGALYASVIGGIVGWMIGYIYYRLINLRYKANRQR